MNTPADFQQCSAAMCNKRPKTNQDQSILRLANSNSNNNNNSSSSSSSDGGSDDGEEAQREMIEASVDRGQDHFVGLEEEDADDVGGNQLAGQHGDAIGGQEQQFKQQIHRNHHLQQHQHKDYDDVKQVELFGVRIVALTINGKERLCLAQISNTLLKEFSYNEIHNRRVALGITCVQCTPIQLEMLRRAGAMPSSSRRCGMITMREAERLCRSFLVEEQPPDLPENFYFTVAHRINYGCKGRFVPARYISSRAKCIECFYCGEFYSPNKFIFHSHRQPNTTDCNPPDSPNINSWRKHIDLDWTQEHSQDIKYAWEDVKSLFNGGTRRRAPNGPTPSSSGCFGESAATRKFQVAHLTKSSDLSDSEQLIDVDDSIDSSPRLDQKQHFARVEKSASRSFEINQRQQRNQAHEKAWPPGGQQVNNSLMLNPPARLSSSGHKSAAHHQACKRAAANHHSTDLHPPAIKQQRLFSAEKHEFASPMHQTHALKPPSRCSLNAPMPQMSLAAGPYNMQTSANEYSSIERRIEASASSSDRNKQLINPSNFIYSQLYNQLVQPSQQQQQVAQGRQLEQEFSSTVDAHLALRHHLWSSLLANLQQSSAADRAYTPFGHLPNTCNTLNLGSANPLPAPGGGLDAPAQPAGGATAVAAANLSHLISAQFYGPALKMQTMPGCGTNADTCKELELAAPNDATKRAFNPTEMLKSHGQQLNESSSDT